MLHKTIRNNDFQRNTALQHCFEWLQQCSNIATLGCAKNCRCESSRVTSPLSNSDGDGYENVTSISFLMVRPLSRLFHLVQFIKCWQFSLELNSRRLYQSSEKEKARLCLVFTSSTKREIRQPAKTSVSPRTSPAAKSEEKRMFSQARNQVF